MNVASDLGGVPGYGPVVPERDEPVFHDRWESRVLALTLAMGATRSWTLDASRFAREDRPRIEYVGIRYYELWFRALERLLLERGLVSSEELLTGTVTVPPSTIEHRLVADDVDHVLRGSRLAMSSSPR
jgi:hypothetical protein